MKGKVLLLFIVYFFFNETVLHSQTVFDTLSTVHITEMHIHAWSNHNGANKPASIQWHAWQADSALYPSVVWYTEHDGIYQNFDTIDISVEGANVDTNNNIVNLKANSLEGDNEWFCIKNDAGGNISISGDTMSLSITNASSQFNELQLAYRHNSDRIKEIEFVKPLAHRPVISFHAETYFPSSYNDVAFELFVLLAWHNRGIHAQDVLWYKFVPSDQLYSQTVLNDDTVLTVVPLNNKADITLDLYNDALSLMDGTDNTFSDLQLKVGSKNDSSITVNISDFTIYSSEQTADSIIKKENQQLSSYDSIYTNIHQLLGIEYSASDVHLNAFLPHSDSVNLYRGVGYNSHDDWVNGVHQAGGIVSYNHMFGTSWFVVDSDSLQDVNSDSTALAIVGNQAFGADYLEVGYLKRGNVDLDRHLKAWDRCTANGFFLYGNGVSDSHGDYWIGMDRLFSTYIWTNSDNASSLLASLSQGRCFMARPMYFKGKFYFSLANAVMGDRTVATETNVSPEIYIDSVQTGYKYTITQILINPSVSDTMHYVYNNAVFDPTNPPLLDLTQPCFVRIMVYDSKNNAIIVSQPIVFLSYSPITKVVKNNETKTFTLRFYQTTDEHLGYIEINSPKTSLFEFEIYDINGRLVKTISPRLIYAGSYTFGVNISELPSGTYLLKATENLSAKSIRFIKK